MPSSTLGLLGEPGDPEFIPGAEVGVGPSGQRSNVVVEYEYWGSSVSAYPDRTSPRGNGNEPVGGLVTLISDAAPMGVTPILEETHAASGVFVSTILICQADSDECTANGGERPTIPVNKEGDAILVTYEDASPKSTHSALLPLDVNGPTLAQFSPASGSAGRENEPIVAFRAIDAESGLIDSDDALGSIYIVAGLYDLDTEKAADSVVFERDELRLSETTYGYTVSVTIHEGRESIRTSLTAACLSMTTSTKSAGGLFPQTTPATSPSATLTAKSSAQLKMLTWKASSSWTRVRKAKPPTLSYSSVKTRFALSISPVSEFLIDNKTQFGITPTLRLKLRSATGSLGSRVLM